MYMYNVMYRDMYMYMYMYNGHHDIAVSLLVAPRRNAEPHDQGTFITVTIKTLTARIQCHD